MDENRLEALPEWTTAAAAAIEGLKAPAEQAADAILARYRPGQKPPRFAGLP